MGPALSHLNKQLLVTLAINKYIQKYYKQVIKKIHREKNVGKDPGTVRKDEIKV